MLSPPAAAALQGRLLESRAETGYTAGPWGGAAGQGGRGWGKMAQQGEADRGAASETVIMATTAPGGASRATRPEGAPQAGDSVQPSPDGAEAPTRHGTVVALNGRGLLLIGPSGSGKSAVALGLIASGAVLVADDRVRLWRQGDRVMAEAPRATAGLIEARGVGILHARTAGPVPLTLICDLGRASSLRLPPPRGRVVLGIALPLVLGPASPHLVWALRQAVLGGIAAV